MLIHLTRAELKLRGAREFAEGDVVHTGKYFIYIKYGQYSRPLKTRVETTSGKILNCTPGTRGGWPYYIDEFIGS